jgi:protein-S-isoprenylcysteine O-methyltransferase Ste14
VIAVINLIVLVLSTFFMAFFYIKSVGPAALEKKIGEKAYPRCKLYRIVASAFEFIAMINYIVYFFYPLPLALPRTFPWDWWVSTLIAVFIFIPSGYLMWRGLKDAGEESLAPKKKHKLYGGIYQKIRHPQATGEVAMWWVIAFALNSPFLAIYSLVWLPIFYLFCWAEERDLVIRYGETYLKYRQNTGFVIPKRTGKAKL